MDVCEEIPHQESLDDGETLQELQEAPRGEAITNAHLTTDDYRIIVTWMEDTTNFEAIHGTGDKPGVGGKPKVRKKDAFKLLAYHLTRHTKNTPIRGLTGRNMQQRWSTYLRRFKKTLRARNNETGLGLTKRELVKKISMPEKLENMCPHFSRMLALFGEKANVKPMATVEMGVSLQSSSDSGDDSDSSDESKGLTQWPPAAQTEELPPATQTLTQQAKALRSRRTLLAEPITPVIHIATQSESTSATSGILSEELEHSQSSTSSQPATDNPPTTPKPSTKGDKWGKSSQQSKRRKTSYDNPKTTEVTKAHESRISLSTAYARNSEAKVDYLKEKLKEERRQWTEKHEAKKRQRELEVQQQERELVERKSLRKHELVLELLRQNKSINEIESFLEKFG